MKSKLFALQDKAYGEFQAKLILGVPPESFIGVRTPELRKMAKEMVKEGGYEAFLSALPHRFFDENQLHAFIISEMKDFAQCLAETDRFLPFVDNWATCDQMSPKVFKKHRPELLEAVKRWILSDRVYTVRFAVGMLMEHFLDADFAPEYPAMVAAVRSEEYYVNMMCAWYFATALAKQWDAVIPYVEENKLDTWTHNKTIQKAVESYRITNEQKMQLRKMRRKQSSLN